MFGFLDRIFGSPAVKARVTAPLPREQVLREDPEFVPTPKPKIPGAVHPGVAASQLRAKGKARGTGIVFDAAGRPKITKDFLDNLPPDERQKVDALLAARGWRVTEDGIVDQLGS